MGWEAFGIKNLRTDHYIKVGDTFYQPVGDFSSTVKTSKYRVLNQAGVGLFDYFLTQSDELWVLFTPRYLKRVWCVFEFAYWLKLREKETKSKRKIKLIPLKRNSDLYRKFPWAHWYATFLWFLYICVMFSSIAATHPGGCDDEGKRITMGLPLCDTALIGVLGVFEGFFVFCFAMFAMVFLNNQYVIKPAAKERKVVIDDLEKFFNVRNLDASYRPDYEHVLNMIAIMWRKDGKAKGTPLDRKAREAALDAFNKDVTGDHESSLKNTLNRLLQQGERNLFLSYLFQVLVSCFLAGVPLLLFSFDSIRPVLSPMIGFWMISNMGYGFVIMFFGTGFTLCCMCGVCMMSHGSWSMKPKNM